MEDSMHHSKIIYKPEFSLGAIVSTCAILGSVITVTTYIGTLSSSVNVNSQRLSTVEQRRQEDLQEVKAMRTEMNQKFDRLQDQLILLNQRKESK